MPFKFLSQSFALQDYYFHVPQMCLGTMGFWPSTHRQNTRDTLWALANFIILFIGVFTEIHAGFTYLKNNNLELGLDTLCPAGTSAVTLLKMFLISYYRDDLHEVLKCMRQMLYAPMNGVSKNLNDIKIQIIRAHSIMAARLNFIPFIMGFITCTTYVLKPLLIPVFYWLQGNVVVWKMPFNMTMPSILLELPFFPFTYIFIAYTGYITIFMFGGCDAFYFEFCSHLTALLKLLQEDVRLLFQPYEDQLVLTVNESHYFEAKLKLIIKRHNDIIDLQRFFVKRFTIITLAHFVSAGMVIGASIFDLLTFSGLGMIIYVTYTIASLGELFIYCYGGTLIVESSIQMANIFNECNWQICNPKLRRMIHLIILRSQRPLTMAVPFFTPSLATFASILHTSGSIIALASSFR